jgi:hypothetical protein
MTRTQKFMSAAAAVAVAAALQAPAHARQDKAGEVLSNTRKAIGGRTLEGLKTFSVQAKVLRNMGSMQVTTDSEFLLEMPDKYLRSDTMSGGPMSISTTIRVQRLDVARAAQRPGHGRGAEGSSG